MTLKAETASKNNGLIIGILCYVLWGILPAYWNQLGMVNPFVVLSARVVFAFLFMMCLLPILRKMQVFWETLRDWKKMKFIIPSAVLIAFNWGLFIWAVNSGLLIYTSLGYFMNPLVSFLLGVIIIKEKCTRLQLVAVGIAFVGVVISVVAYGSIPLVSISLALTFALYGVLKKKAKADPIASIAIESMLMTPFALIFAFGFMTESIHGVSLAEGLLLVGGGALTSIPLVMYSRAVNDIPFTVIGFLQYIGPSLSMMYGLMIGLRPSESQIVSFIFIWIGLIVFSIALVRNARAVAVASSA